MPLKFSVWDTESINDVGTKDANAKYEITDLMTSKVTRLTGKELTEKGIEINIDSKPGAVVLIYKKL